MNTKQQSLVAHVVVLLQLSDFWDMVRDFQDIPCQRCHNYRQSSGYVSPELQCFVVATHLPFTV